MKETPDILANAYIKLREAIKSKEEEIKNLKAKQEKINEKFNELCEEQNIDSLRTPAGTITRRVHTSYWASDWDQMHEFIGEHKAFHLLERRVSNRNMAEFLEANPDIAPPGLQVNRKYVISVRKPPNK